MPGSLFGGMGSSPIFGMGPYGIMGVNDTEAILGIGVLGLVIYSIKFETRVLSIAISLLTGFLVYEGGVG